MEGDKILKSGIFVLPFSLSTYFSTNKGHSSQKNLKKRKKEGKKKK